MRKFSLHVVFFVVFFLTLFVDQSTRASDMFQPPAVLENPVSLASYDKPVPIPESLDIEWMNGLKQAIQKHFDAGVILDVGHETRPHPRYRVQNDFTDKEDVTTGNGVIIFASKGNRLYIYGTDLKLLHTKAGIDFNTFKAAVRNVLSDPKVITLYDDPTFLDPGQIGAAAFAAVLAFAATNAWDFNKIQLFAAMSVILAGGFYGLDRLLKAYGGKKVLMKRFTQVAMALESAPSSVKERVQLLKFSILDPSLDPLLQQIGQNARQLEWRSKILAGSCLEVFR